MPFKGLRPDRWVCNVAEGIRTQHEWFLWYNENRPAVLPWSQWAPRHIQNLQDVLVERGFNEGFEFVLLRNGNIAKPCPRHNIDDFCFRKMPKQKGWDEITPSPMEVHDWLMKGGNIGVKTLHDRTKNLVVVDVDHWDLTAPYNRLLQETFSVRSHRGVHMYFRRGEKEIVASEGIEISGTYAIYPYSKHPTGDMYQPIGYKNPIISSDRFVEVMDQ